MTSLTLPTTTNPCPDWCELQPGHGSCSDSHDGKHSYRSHSLSMTLRTAERALVGLDIAADEETDFVPDDITEPVSTAATIGEPRIYLARRRRRRR